MVRGISETWDIVLDLLPEIPGRVLDAGCGEHTWAAEGATITRCDSWQEYHDGREVDSSVMQVDLQKPWPYRDAEFDGVVASDVIEHLENIWHFFREAFRAARRYVIITTPAVEGRMSRDMFHRVGLLWGFQPEEVERSHHLQPVFLWQMRIAADHAGWRISKVRYAHRGVRPAVAKRYQLPEYVGDVENERSMIVLLEVS